MNRNGTSLGIVLVIILVALFGWRFRPGMEPVVTSPAAQPRLAQARPVEEALPERQVEFAGIGAALTMKNGKLTVENAMPDSPAMEAHLERNTVIEKIDDTDTAGKTIADCVKLVRGPEGSTVRLGIIDPATGEKRTVEVTRRTIRLKE